MIISMNKKTKMEQQHHPRRRRRSTNLIAIATLAGSLLIASYLIDPHTHSKNIDYNHFIPPNRFLLANGDDGNRILFHGSPRTTTLRKKSPEDATAVRKSFAQASRLRADKLEEASFRLAPEIAQSVSATANKLAIPPARQHTVSSFDVDSALLAVRSFQKEILFFVYDSATDDFVVLHNLPACEWGCKRAYIIAPVLAFALRKNYPQRFQGGRSGDLVFLLSVGDMPRVRRPCLFADSKYCKSVNWAPILQFGSVLADPMYMPSVIAMPQSPRPHIPCFDEFQTTGKVCQDLQPRIMNARQSNDDGSSTQDLKTGKHFHHGLVFGHEFGLLNSPTYWNDLIPQVVWRGTDFMFLHTLFPDMRAPTYAEDIAPKADTFGNDVLGGAIKALWEMGDDKLTPRWRGVLLTSEAELEAREPEARHDHDLAPPASLPWLDLKFASCNVDGQKVPASQNSEFQLLEKFGIAAIGQSMNMKEQARYKYHIDLGGGGGTTWTGTIEKLALPGVLFHHVTPTKDWFHGHLEPWVHYIPVRTDLGDLRSKYEWAEGHPQEARKIAEAGTEFARYLGSEEGFAQLYQEHVVAPLGNIITAYQQPRKKYKGRRLLDILQESEFKGVKDEFGVVARCGGWPAESSECRWTTKKKKKAEEGTTTASGVAATE